MAKGEVKAAAKAVAEDAVAASAPTERTSKVPAWATQLRELTTRKREVRGR